MWMEVRGDQRKIHHECPHQDDRIKNEVRGIWGTKRKDENVISAQAQTRGERIRAPACRTYEDNTKMYLPELNWEDVFWTHLAQGKKACFQ